MKTIISTLTVFFFCTAASFGQHSLDSCKACHCKKWHRTFSADTLTKEKIIVLSKWKGNGDCYNNYTNCKTPQKIAADGRCDYHCITSQYYNNGQLHKKNISKGWLSGWGGKCKTIEIIYDRSGKQIRKTKKHD